MIRRVFSSLDTFKGLKFGAGLNILLADKSPGATEQQTRNRAGKSSLIDVIHFVCGGRCDPDSPFRAPQLVQSTFGLEMDVFGETVRVSRSASEPAKIIVEAGDTTAWPKQPKSEKDTGRRVITNAAWRAVLGQAFFKLEADPRAEDDEAAAGRPTFRSLFSYFVRRETSGGMRDATRNSALQQLGNAQIAVSYLIGIDWTIAQQWEAVRQKEKQIRELKRVVGQGVLTEVLDSAASLRARLVVSEEKLGRIVSALSTFRVHDRYESLEREAAGISRKLADLADENEVDRSYILELDGAMAAEAPPAPTDLSRLYAEAGVVLPESVRKRYEDVVTFHESVVRNRRTYLESERVAAAERMSARARQREEYDRRRAELMAILKAHGALDQFVQMQAEHGRLQAETQALRLRFAAAEQLESTSSSLESDRVQLVTRLRQEFHERSSVLNEAMITFSNIVEELYGESGQLEFHATNNGPEFRIAIQGDRSRGINNMEIFCFDMMVQRMCKRQQMGTGFVVHDSHLFDGVDSRQTGRALILGARYAAQNSFQYIVTLNSDMCAELPDNIREFAIPTRLTDATDDGGLFGIRFEPPRPNGEDTPRRRRVASGED